LQNKLQNKFSFEDIKILNKLNTKDQPKSTEYLIVDTNVDDTPVNPEKPTEKTRYV